MADCIDVRLPFSVEDVENMRAAGALRMGSEGAEFAPILEGVYAGAVMHVVKDQGGLVVDPDVSAELAKHGLIRLHVRSNGEVAFSYRRFKKDEALAKLLIRRWKIGAKNLFSFGVVGDYRWLKVTSTRPQVRKNGVVGVSFVEKRARAGEPAWHARQSMTEGPVLLGVFDKKDDAIRCYNTNLLWVKYQREQEGQLLDLRMFCSVLSGRMFDASCYMSDAGDAPMVDHLAPVFKKYSHLVLQVAA